MGSGEFLTIDEERRVVALIGSLENRTTGEIRVHLARRVSRHGVMADAVKAFKKLGMSQTRHHNGVLIYVAFKDRKVACVGDAAIHSKMGEPGWQKLVAEITSDFAGGNHYQGLHRAVSHMGEVLATHFPSDGSPRGNELSDEISRS